MRGKHPAALDFHHRDSTKKRFSIGDSIAKFSLSKLVDECIKCDVVCSNCHRKHHYDEREARKASNP